MRVRIDLKTPMRDGVELAADLYYPEHGERLWIGIQPWCDGHIGMFGSSYPGFTQILPATQRSSFVEGLVPMANQEDNYGHLRCDGVLQLQNTVNFVWLGDRLRQVVTGEFCELEEIYRRLPLQTALDDLADRAHALRRFQRSRHGFHRDAC